MDILVCGNPTIDEIVGPQRVVLAPGGSALYASAASAYLGAKVGILGCVGDDYPETVLDWLRGRRVNLKWLKRTHGPTTRFRIRYAHGSRTLSLLQPGEPMTSQWGGSRVHGVHLGPVFNEIPKSLVKSVRRRCKLLSLDIQGLVRQADPYGSVRTVRRQLRDTLKVCDLVKGSADEVKIQTLSRDPLNAIDRLLSSGPGYAVATLGTKGSLLGIKCRGKFLIPAFPEPHAVDPTGAGDVFVGSWLRTYLSTGDPVWAASVGSGFASLTSKRRGLAKFAISRTELARRASWVYANVKAL